MTEALRQAHIALTAIFTHPTLELSDFMRDKLTAAIAAAEAELSQPVRVGLTSDRLFKMAADAESPEWGEWFNDEDALLKFARAIERDHNIPAAQEGK